VTQTANRLHVAANTVYDLVERDELGHYRVGRSIRILPADIDAYQRDTRPRQRTRPLCEPKHAAWRRRSHDQGLASPVTSIASNKSLNFFRPPTSLMTASISWRRRKPPMVVTVWPTALIWSNVTV